MNRSRGNAPKALPAALCRPFRLIAFDWDGTAVANRQDDAGPVLAAIERLLRVGVVVVVVTGTNLRNIDAQFASRVRGPHKRNLFVATNRGSEVFCFGDDSEPHRCWYREATQAENRLLSEIAEGVRAILVARTRLEVQIISDRLNRRKIDLIPIERWADPPKNALGELLAAVETRLASAGLSGIGEALELTHRVAREKGLSQARVTSDVKHIEVGLTDKADALAWVYRELVGPHGIPSSEVLIAGDEFGPIAGLTGSDSLMMIPDAAGATFVSVGPEPGGVPEPVIHLGGGPEQFRALLEVQAALHPVVALGQVGTPDWALVDEGVALMREREFESLFCISNGLVGTRGSVAEGTPSSRPATFVAGVFEPEPGSVPTMACTVDWPAFSASVEGNPIGLGMGDSLEHRRILDMQQGVLLREWRFRDKAGRVTRFRGVRFASLADRSILGQSLTFTPENYAGTITIRARLSQPSVSHTASGVTIACVPATQVEYPERTETVQAASSAGTEPEELILRVELGKTYRVDRVVSIHTSAIATERPLESARSHARRALEEGMPRLLQAHRGAWRERWNASEIVLEGDPAIQKALRFAAYHLIGAANPDNEHYSIGARALTGPAYKGHVFWDTEVYMLPFYLFTYPEAARALLMYRYHTLPGARAKAARAGYQGAMYAWESADTGEDVTPAFVIAPDGEVLPIRVGDEEQHITADVAFAVWKYWEATRDEKFLLDAGAEILLDTATFWASRVQRGSDGLWHISRVIGPDEYHESVDDNAFTNGMAKYNLELGVRAATLLAERWPERWHELIRKLRLHDDDLGRWAEIANKMYTGFDASSGLFEQFRGYFDLEEMNLPPFEQRTAPADVLFGRARVQRSKLIKQPDVLMLIYLLWDRFPERVREANFRYYEPRTSHGSSLSPPIHAALSARLGQPALAEQYLRQTAEIDLSDNMGNASGGVHAAALGGLWQAMVFGFAGLSLTDEGPRLAPVLPPQWRHLSFAVRWRGECYLIDLPQQTAAKYPIQEVHP